MSLTFDCFTRSFVNEYFCQTLYGAYIIFPGRMLVLYLGLSIVKISRLQTFNHTYILSSDSYELRVLISHYIISNCLTLKLTIQIFE